MSHKCPTVVLYCIDFRFWQKMLEYLKEQGEKEFDYINLAGGAKNVIDEDTRSIIFKQLDICTEKHAAEKVILVNHIDCGAYGGSDAFGSPEEEREQLIGDLHKAGEIIKAKYPNLEVNYLLHTFEGVEKV